MRWMLLFVIVIAACSDSRDEGSKVSATTQPSAPMVRKVAVSGYAIVPGRPGAFDVRAPEGWPGRALDPVLSIGDSPRENMRFSEYSFPARDRIRFTIPDTAALPAGAAVFVQFGDDDASRVLVTQSLEVPR
jgi:hypothetical protein